MLTNRLHLRTASARGGFTLVELLVVIGIIAILAGVALGPIMNGLKQAKRNAYMQQSRQVGQVMFSYATDNTANGNNYPSDSSALLICQDLLNAGYATDPNLFGVPGQTGFVKATGAASTLTAPGVSFCFTTLGVTTASGITPSSSDLTPVVYFNNGAGASPCGATITASPGTAINATITAAAPFATDGMAIFYKGNNAVYIKSFPVNSGTIPGFVSANDNDTTAYTVIK